MKSGTTELVILVAVVLLGGVALSLPGIARPVTALALGVVGLVVSLVSGRASRVRRRRLLADREPFSADDIYERHFAASGLDKQTVTRLWGECAQKLRIPADKLRPEDRFEHELAVADVWESLDDPREDLAEYALGRAKQLGVQLDLRAAATVGDLVRSLAAAERGPSRRAQG